MKRSMKKPFLLCPAFAVLLLPACDRQGESGEEARPVRPARPDASRRGVQVQRITYHGWKDAWRLSNGRCEAVIVPAIGRLMRFSFQDGPNILWENLKLRGRSVKGTKGGWVNFGGDKLWPSAQKHWRKFMGRGWPPDRAYDGRACTAQPIPNGVRLVTPLSRHFGSRGVREFVLRPERAALHVRQWHEKKEGAPVPLCVWTVTQVRTPRWAILPLPDGQKVLALSKGALSEEHVRRHKSFVTIRNHPKKAQKIGVGGKEGWVAGLIGRTLFVQTHRVAPNAAYPDGGAQAEVYTQAGAEGYVELELLSPLAACARGATLRDDAVWELMAVSPDEAKAEQRLARRARAARQRALKWLEE